MNIFVDTTKQQMKSVKNYYASKRKDDKIYLYQGSLPDYSWKNTIDYAKKYYVHIISFKTIVEIYGRFVIYNVVYESYIKNITNHWINAIKNFNNEHIIQRYNVTQYNIPEEERYISYIPPTVFINGQDESTWYVNLLFQFYLFSILSDS